MIPVRRGWLILLLLLCAPPPGHGQSEATRAWADSMFLKPPAAPLIPEFLDAYGVVFRDLDGNGLPDIYVVRFRDLNRLFINRGPERSMLDYTISSGLGGNLMSHVQQNLELGASAADVDNDGRPDVLIVGWGITTDLYQQRSTLVFRQALAIAETFPPIDGNGGMWADIERDGDLDLFITDEHHPNHLFIQEAGRFAEAGRAYGVADSGTSQGAAFADFDGDGFPDLYVCNWFGPDRLYRNDGGTGFRPVRLPIPHLTASLKSNGVTPGDIDNDGDLDLLVSDRDGRTSLYRNDTVAGDTLWLFHDMTAESGLDNSFPAYGTVIADLDNDGWQDIFIANIGPNQAFRNRGDGTFERIYRQPIVRQVRQRNYSTGVATADVDGDGDLDLFVANKDSSSILFRNPLRGGRAIRLAIEGVISNRDGIGTMAWLYRRDADGRSHLVGYRELSGGSGYLSLSEPVLHFGVGDGSGDYWGRVRFPSGRERRIESLQPGTVHAVAEVTGLARTARRTGQYLARLSQSPHFWLNVGLFLTLIAMLVAVLWVLIRRYQVRYLLISAFLVGVVVVVYAVFWLMPDAEAWQALLAQLVLLVLAAGVIGAFLEKIHRLERRRFGYRELLRRFSEQLILIRDNADLFTRLTTTIHQALAPRFCALLEVKSGRVHRRSVAGEWPAAPDTLPYPSRAAGLRSGSALPADAVAALLPGAAATGVQLVIPVTRQKQPLAFLVIGAPATGGEALRPDDIELLQILAGQAAIAIENNRYIDESKRMIQRLTEAETRERYVEELENKNRTLEQLYRELQETQSQLIQSEKMAGLGQLVAGIAHELNNPISFVYANMKELERYTEGLREVLALLHRQEETPLSREEFAAQLAELDRRHDLRFVEADMDQLIEESLEGSRRVKSVVENLRNFSRLDEAHLKAVDLHDGLESTLLLLAHELKNRVTVHRDFGDLPAVTCNPGHINQVFMNLLHNAIQAMPDGGDIFIRTRATDEGVQVAIRDTGTGIPEADLPRIFDPFFTTKPVGTGTGLGLSISYNIIRKHGGRIAVERHDGRGTTFTVTLPLTPPPSGDGRPSPHEEHA